MFSLTHSIATVPGVGPKLASTLQEAGITTVQDLLLYLPLRYEDRSLITTIADAPHDQLLTLEAEVISARQYRKGPRTIQQATISDDTDQLKVMWFNNRWIMDTLKEGERFRFSGKINERGTLLQPTVEKLAADTIHTGRLVPIYSSTVGLKQGSLRRILKSIVDHLTIETDLVSELSQLPALTQALRQLHFPDQAEQITQSRERLALEELLSLIAKSHLIKDQWQQLEHGTVITPVGELIPSTVPFTLTAAQSRALSEIMADLARPQPMNRLLIGDVGSGKTVVAGIAAWHTIQQGHTAALIAPTQILAEQHASTLRKIFPQLEIELVTGRTKKTTLDPKTQLMVGTHAVINRLAELKPALVIFDEQHRFGVNQRSQTPESAHVLTMTATPIPRSLMLTIFAHLSLSVIDELPAGRLPVTTWLVPQQKRAGSYTWIEEQLTANPGMVVLVVCPLIDPSDSEALENVAAVHDQWSTVQAALPKRRVGLLHGRLKPGEKTAVTEQLYNGGIDVLVTTPVIEVGLDVPAASIIVIEAAERFGLASLHQLRGRVGRAGQQAYCLLFATPGAVSATAQTRLEKFCHLHNGLELAELDLQRRGAGDIFGTRQHGFDDLRFAAWTDLELITTARKLYNQLQNSGQLKQWHSVFPVLTTSTAATPVAN